MNLFRNGLFSLSSGQHSLLKLDLDALSPLDWNTLALLALRLPTLQQGFGRVLGVPTGGTPFAKALGPFISKGPTLLVDDVLTTGRSLETLRARLEDEGKTALGLVVFSRGHPPEWVDALFYLHEQLWEV